MRTHSEKQNGSSWITPRHPTWMSSHMHYLFITGVRDAHHFWCNCSSPLSKNSELCFFFFLKTSSWSEYLYSFYEQVTPSATSAMGALRSPLYLPHPDNTSKWSVGPVSWWYWWSLCCPITFACSRRFLHSVFKTLAITRLPFLWAIPSCHWKLMDSSIITNLQSCAMSPLTEKSSLLFWGRRYPEYTNSHYKLKCCAACLLWLFFCFWVPFLQT